MGPIKSLRKAKETNFKANFSFFKSLLTGEAHVFEGKFIGLYGTVGFLVIQTFLFEEKAICGVTSGRRWMEWFRGLSRQGKNERFVVARRETRKHIASFKETKYDFSL